MSIIIKQLLETINKSNIKSLNQHEFNEISNSTIYDQINAISNSEKVYIAMFIITALYIFSKITINANLLLGTTVIFWAVYYWINNKNNNLTNDNIDFTEKLNYLESFLFNSDIFQKRKNIHKNILNILPNNMPPEKKSYLHTSQPVIDFYYSIRELSQYNPANYTLSLNSMNNILKLNVEMEVGVDRPKDKVDIAQMEAKRCLNALQSCILTIPSDSTYNNFFNESLKSLERLTNLYINTITNIAFEYYEKIYKNNEINTASVQIIKDQPNANDTNAYDFSENYNFY